MLPELKKKSAGCWGRKKKREAEGRRGQLQYTGAGRAPGLAGASGARALTAAPLRPQLSWAAGCGGRGCCWHPPPHRLARAGSSWTGWPLAPRWHPGWETPAQRPAPARWAAAAAPPPLGPPQLGRLGPPQPAGLPLAQQQVAPPSLAPLRQAPALVQPAGGNVGSGAVDLRHALSAQARWEAAGKAHSAVRAEQGSAGPPLVQSRLPLPSA